MKSCIRILLLLFIFCNSPVSSQQNDDRITTYQFSVEDGLASRQVFCGLQDKQGFIWFGTGNGLNRFDGKNFLLFTQQHNNMQDNKVLQLATDDANHLFIEYGLPDYSMNTCGKVDVMNLTTHEVKTMTETFPKMPFKESDIYKIENDGSDELDIITAFPFKLWHYSSQKGFMLKCEMKEWDKIPNRYPMCRGAFWQGNAFLFISGNPARYYVTADSAYVLNSISDSIFLGHLSAANKEFLQGICSPLGMNIFYTEKDNPGNVKQLNTSKEFHFSGGMNDTTTYTYTSPGYSMIVKQADGIYLCSRAGMQKLTGTDEIKEFNNLVAYETFIDRQGHRWICTSVNVLEIKIQKKYFYSYFTKSQQSIEANNTQARGIYSDSTGKIYANIGEYLFIADHDKIKTAYAADLLYDLLYYRHQLFAGSPIFRRYDEDKNILKEIEPPEIPNEAWSMLPLSENILLVGRAHGIFLFDIKKEQFTQAATLLQHIPKANFVYRFIRGTDGKIWACSENGLFILNEKGDITDYYGTQVTDKTHLLPFDKFYDIYEDAQGIFWLATNGEGLYRWDRGKNEFRQFTEADGMPSDILYRIEADDFGHLWISSDYGLIRFNKKDFGIHTYTVNDGISHNEFNRISSFKAANGRMFFGGLNGINAFYPKDMQDDTATNNAPLRITSFTKFSSTEDKLLNLTSDLLVQNKITLEPGDRFFDLQFMLLDYEPGKEIYAYKIEGLDSNWNYIHESSIRLSGLPYGDFVLHVKGQNAYGVWSSSELKISLTVVTPYYRRAWFIIICIVLLMVGIYLIIYFRTKKFQTEKIKLEKTVSDRTLQLQESLGKQEEMLKEKDLLMKEIHHRVKNNLQVISGLLELQNTGIDDEKAKQAILEGQNRVRSIALIHQNLYQNENMAFIEFREFVSELYRQVYGLFGKPGMKLETNFELEKTLLDIDTAVPLGLIVNELLTNSFKYAFTHQTGKIKVKVNSYTNGEYCLEYYDSGPGLPAGTDIDKVRSLGLRLISRLSRQLGGKTEYAYDNGGKFSIWFKDTMARRSTD